MACAVLLFSPSTVFAGSFTVAPNKIFFHPAAKICTVQVINNGDKKISIEADAFVWDGMRIRTGRTSIPKQAI